jgi:hypothetical protein
LGDSGNMPYSHFGYLMAMLGLIDTLSLCDSGRGEQTPRMRTFLGTYVHPTQAGVNTVLVQMMRHTLMHTGALRYLFNSSTRVAYLAR